MAAPPCAAHPGVAALFRCDGCGRFLCNGCVDQGHRLLFCRHCRERALPLDERIPATRAGVRAAAASGTFDWSSAMRYPLRGQGSGVFWVYVVLLVVLELASKLPFVGLALLGIRLVLSFLIPGLLYAIVRRTADGGDELPDWPDWEPGERFREVCTFWVTAVVAIIPAIAALALCLGHAALPTGQATPSVGCLVMAAGGLLVGVAIAVPMTGSLAIYEHLDLLVRLDLHVRALVIAGGEGLRIVGLVFVVVVLGQVLAGVLGLRSILGGALAGIVSAYGSFVAAHLVGWMFRRHADQLDELYRV